MKLITEEQRLLKNKKRREYYWNNREKCKFQNKKSREKHLKEIKEKRKLQRKINSAKIKEQKRLSYLRNKDKIKQKAKFDYYKNKEKKINYQKEYYYSNIEKIKNYSKNYRKNNRTIFNKNNLKRYNSDLQFKITCNIRNRIRLAIKNQNCKNLRKTNNLLGCSIEELKIHLESQFKDSMTWDNWKLDGWHIDHIKPCSSFDLTDPNQQKECFNYKNLQPLWWYENLSKGSKIIDS
jgi:hypothetical protein